MNSEGCSQDQPRWVLACPPQQCGPSPCCRSPFVQCILGLAHLKEHLPGPSSPLRSPESASGLPVTPRPMFACRVSPSPTCLTGGLESGQCPPISQVRRLRGEGQLPWGCWKTVEGGGLISGSLAPTRQQRKYAPCPNIAWCWEGASPCHIKGTRHRAWPCVAPGVWGDHCHPSGPAPGIDGFWMAPLPGGPHPQLLGTVGRHSAFMSEYFLCFR